MVSGFKLLLGFLLLLGADWCGECASPYNLKIRREATTSRESLESSIQALDSTIATTTSVNSITNKSETTRNTSSTTSPKSIADIIDNIEPKKDEEIVTDEDSHRNDSGRSIDVDIEKYVSPEFHSKSHVYDVATSPEIEKYISDQHHLTTKSMKWDFVSEQYKNVELTTPKTALFDARYKHVQEGIKKQIEKADLSIKTLDGEEDQPHPDPEDTKVDVTYTKYKGSKFNSSPKKNGKHHEHEASSGKNVDVRTSFLVTSSYDDPDDGEYTKEDDDPALDHVSATQIEKDDQPETSTTIPLTTRQTFSHVRHSVTTAIPSTTATRLEPIQTTNSIRNSTLLLKRKFPATTASPMSLSTLSINKEFPALMGLLNGSTVIKPKRGSVKYTTTTEEYSSTLKPKKQGDAKTEQSELLFTLLPSPDNGASEETETTSEGATTVKTTTLATTTVEPAVTSEAQTTYTEEQTTFNNEATTITLTAKNTTTEATIIPETTETTLKTTLQTTSIDIFPDPTDIPVPSKGPKLEENTIQETTSTKSETTIESTEPSTSTTALEMPQTDILPENVENTFDLMTNMTASSSTTEKVPIRGTFNSSLDNTTTSAVSKKTTSNSVAGDVEEETNTWASDETDYLETKTKPELHLTPKSVLPEIQRSGGESIDTQSPFGEENSGRRESAIDSDKKPIPAMVTSQMATTTAEAETTTPPEYKPINDGDDDSPDGGTIAAIVISSIAAVCLIMLGILLVVMRKRQKRMTYGQRCTPVSLDAYSLDNVSVYNSVRRKAAARASKRSYGNPAFDDPTCISNALKFPELARFAVNQEAINGEFDEVPQVTAQTSEVPAGCEDKNRYANVVPLTETRVYLEPTDTDPTSDYINANYVTGPKNKKDYYIACQAPMANTVDDFWRMVWEQQSKVILMLTKHVEGGVEKCYDYLPTSEVSDCNRSFGDFQVTLKKREEKEKYTISSVQLKNMVSNSWRDITHLWYIGWPEKGVPSEANSIIAFLIEARSHVKIAHNNNSSSNADKAKANGKAVGPKEGSPVVVHCSPGTGRTGTVIACDIAIRDFEQNRQVDIPRTVYAVRRGRASAVTTRDQYAFIYKVISLYATKLTGGVLDSFN